MITVEFTPDEANAAFTALEKAQLFTRGYGGPAHPHHELIKSSMAKIVLAAHSERVAARENGTT